MWYRKLSVVRNYTFLSFSIIFCESNFVSLIIVLRNSLIIKGQFIHANIQFSKLKIKTGKTLTLCWPINLTNIVNTFFLTSDHWVLRNWATLLSNPCTYYFTEISIVTVSFELKWLYDKNFRNLFKKFNFSPCIRSYSMFIASNIIASNFFFIVWSLNRNWIISREWQFVPES
jgi:hypothetical protein